MGYTPQGGSGYGGQSRRSGIGKRFGSGKGNRNFNRDFVGGNDLARGSLSDYGWKATAPDEQRRQALLNCVRAEGFAATSVKLQTLQNGVGVPEIDRAIAEDLNWLTTEAQLDR